MANLCYNHALLTGDKAIELFNDLTAFKEKEKPNGFGISFWYTPFYEFLGQIVGIDVPYSDAEDAPYSYDVFGSRYFKCEFEMADDNSVRITGESAWSPVVPFIQLICQKYSLTAKGDYEESGCDFGGFFTIDEDQQLADITMSYNAYRYHADFDLFFEYICENASFGDYETIEEVYSQFDVEGAKPLTAEEKAQLLEAFKESQTN